MQTCTYGLGEGNRKSTAVMPQDADCLSYLEKPYKNALFYALRKHGFSVEKEKHYTILYDDITVGSYFADLVLENKIIIEVKAVNEIEKNMIAQTINYLKVSELPLGFIVNVRNKSVQFRRLENKNPHNPP